MIFFLISQSEIRSHDVNYETVLMKGHKICFFMQKIRKIITKLSMLPLLIWNTEKQNINQITYLAKSRHFK